MHHPSSIAWQKRKTGFLSIICVSDTAAVMEEGSIFVARGRLRALDGYSTGQDAQ